MLWMADSIRGLISVWNVMDFLKSCFGETLLKGITAILEKTLWKKPPYYNTWKI